jgi:hypothetical protein
MFITFFFVTEQQHVLLIKLIFLFAAWYMQNCLNSRIACCQTKIFMAAGHVTRQPLFCDQSGFIDNPIYQIRI